MTWTILTFYLWLPANSYVTGEFTSQQYCINALKYSQPPENVPQVRQCVQIDKKDFQQWQREVK
jgi:hypothetical protein